MTDAEAEELATLRRQNAELAEQVKRLVRTESNLYAVQEQLDAQSASYRIIAEIERKLADATHLDAILDLALECVIAGIQVERAVILFATAPGAPLGLRRDEGYYKKADKARIAGLSLPRDHALLEALGARPGPLHAYAETNTPVLAALRESVLMDEFIVLPLTRGFDQPDAGVVIAGNRSASGVKFTRIRPGSQMLMTLGSAISHVKTTIENMRSYEQLQARNVEVERANRMKSAFLATISHELRTPLNAIIGFTRIVMRKAGPAMAPLQLANLGKVESSALNLLAIINDILDLSKVEAGRLELLASSVQVTTVVRDVLEQLSPLASAKALTLAAELGDNVPPIETDEQRVRQILVNLVSNAIKFTKEGSIRVKLTQPKPDVVELVVLDTGIGIPDDERENIFAPFHQVNGGTTREVGGTGLGLAIVKEMVKTLGGTISVASVVSVGSAFTVRLPVRLPPIFERHGHEASALVNGGAG